MNLTDSHGADVPMEVEIPSDRDAFEAWYCRHAMQECGFDMRPEDIAAKRDGDGYGVERGYLNGCWQTWKALRPHGVDASRDDQGENRG